MTNITVSAPACADDIALLGESKDIQAMLNLLEYNTKRDLVKLNPEKTEVINQFCTLAFLCLISILSVVWSPHLTFRISPSRELDSTGKKIETDTTLDSLKLHIVLDKSSDVSNTDGTRSRRCFSSSFSKSPSSL
jgi:hypothetical protein